MIPCTCPSRCTTPTHAHSFPHHPTSLILRAEAKSNGCCTVINRCLHSHSKFSCQQAFAHLELKRQCVCGVHIMRNLLLGSCSVLFVSHRNPVPLILVRIVPSQSITPTHVWAVIVRLEVGATKLKFTTKVPGMIFSSRQFQLAYAGTDLGR